MAEAVANVEELVGMVQRRELLLPEMQRRFVWRTSRVRDLLDSLYRGYPSGTILVWETDEEVPLRELSVRQEGAPYRSTLLLLDGQQRITSLSAVIRGEPVKVRGRERPVELLFNLEHPEDLGSITEVNEDDDDDERTEDEADSTDDELQRRLDRSTFIVSTKKLEGLPTWVKVSDVFKSSSDSAFLSRLGLSGFDDPRYQKYTERLARLRDVRKYRYRMDKLERRMTYNEVTEIFVRVNSLGAKLRSSDLALAQITATWRHSLAKFEAFQEQCAKAGFDLDLGLLLKNMIAFATGRSRFLTVGELSREKLEQAWDQSCRGMEFALNFLRSNVEIESPALLSSPFILVALAYFAHCRDYKIAPAESDDLRFWTLVANAKGRYSRGSSETLLDQDLASIQEGAGTDALIDRLRLQVGRLDITPRDLEGRNQRSALFKTMFLAFRAAGAKDWRTDLRISLDHSGSRDKLQFHHIFPKAKLKGVYGSREADDIANLAFIGGNTNRRISAELPIDYLPPLFEKSPHAFKAQCVPMARDLLPLDAYHKFLAERRRSIAERLNEFLAVGSASASA